MVRYYVFPLLDTLTFDQHMLCFSEFCNGFSLAWSSTLRAATTWKYAIYISYEDVITYNLRLWLWLFPWFSVCANIKVWHTYKLELLILIGTVICIYYWSWYDTLVVRGNYRPKYGGSILHSMGWFGVVASYYIM